MEAGEAPASAQRLYCTVIALVIIFASLVITDSAMNPALASAPFSSDRMVSDPDEVADQYYPDVAVAPNGTVYVVWEDSRYDTTPGSPPYVVDIFISSSSNRGATFSPNVQITNHSQSVVKSQPAIAVDGVGTVYVTWWDNTGLYLQKSSDGVSFSEPVEVSAGVNGTFKIAPSICAPAPGTIYVAYSSPDALVGRIFLATSADGGNTFSSVRVDDSTHSYRTNPDLAVGPSGSLNVVWQDERNGDSDIFFSKSVNGGETFLPNVKVNDDVGTTDQDMPSVAIHNGGAVYVVWRDWRNGNSDIFFSKSMDGGITFGDGLVNNNDLEVDDYPGNAIHDYPVVAADVTGNIFVAWRDTRNGFSDQDIYFSQSEDGGLTFGDGIKNDNDIKVNDDVDDTDQELPAMALTPDGSVCIVWYDTRNLAEKRVDIYFSTFLGAAPDLAIAGGPVNDVTFVPPGPQVEGTSITISATVHNYGTEVAYDIVVRFYDDSPDPQKQIGIDEHISLIPAGENASVSTVWVCQGTGVHMIFAWADPEDEIIEWNEGNNLGGSSFTVLSTTNPSRPTDVTAFLFGLALTGVMLQWTLSVDDNGGRRSVERYDIYRGETFNSIGGGYQLIGSVPGGKGQFIDQSGGYLNPNDYFYMVCAYNSTLGSSCSETQGGKTNTEITAGWNLVSFPLLLRNQSLEWAFMTIDFGIVRRYDAQSSVWASYYPHKGYSVLQSVDVSIGYWVQFPTGGNLTLAGQVPRESLLHLEKGWNLVAIPSFANNVSLADLTSSLPVIDAKAFDPSSPPHYLKQMGDFSVFDPKRGYWIEALETVSISITN